MHRFKNNVSDGWIFRQELRFFENLARNWDRDVEDCDFFDPFGNGNNSDSAEATALFKKLFPLETLAKLDGISVERSCPDEDPDEADPIARHRLRLRHGDAEGRVVDVSIRHPGQITGCLQELWNQKPLRTRCREMLREWSGRMERRLTRRRSRRDPLEVRVDEVCRVLKLSDIERDLFTYALVRSLTCFDDFPCRRTQGRSDHVFLAMATDWPCSEVSAALAPEGKLRQFDILDADGDQCRTSPIAVFLEGGSAGMLEGQFFRKVPVDDALPWEYYGRLVEEHGDILKDLIRSARGRRGANILLYGAPGTGKTSFAKTLARELGLGLFEIRQGARDRERDYTPESRIAGIRICNEQVPQGSGIVLVDEADQLLRTSLDFFAAMFGGAGAAGSEKGVINTVLDAGKLPAIWISNAPADALDDSVRRRFDYSVRFEKLTAAQRKTIWLNSIEKFGLGRLVPPEMAGTLAEKYPTSAGGIAMVLENVRRMRPRKGAALALIDKLMTPHCELMGAGLDDDRLAPARDYSLEGLNIRGDMPLERIVEAVGRFREEKDGDADPDRPRMNLLLWGPPGTGKTEFVKHLGETLGAKVSVKMGSDLLSMWVGGTEKNIRRAFEDAEADDAILFLDEIDGLVQDRSGARQSWEVTQVNELLHRMENFRGVMVAATNFMANLDAAILRRFTFKLQFDYLDDVGKRLFFERMFRTTLTPEEERRLAAIPRLAPGDFRTVRQSLHYLAGEPTNAMRLGGLENESRLKKDGRGSGSIGF